MLSTTAQGPAFVITSEGDGVEVRLSNGIINKRMELVMIRAGDSLWRQPTGEVIVKSNTFKHEEIPLRKLPQLIIHPNSVL